MDITEYSTYREIISVPELIDLQDYLFHLPVDQLLSNLDVPISGNIPEAWNPKDIAAGFNRLIDLKKQGVKVLHQIYSEQERELDQEKRQTGLLYFPAGHVGPFALICAGGAYMEVASDVEAFPVAAKLNLLGVNTFVLKYRTSVQKSAEKAELDLHTALHYILNHAEKLGVTKNYSVIGFSSGGHLVAELGTINRGYTTAGLPKPDMLVLAYPAVNLYYRSELMDAIVDIMLGSDWKEEDRKKFSVVEHMDRSYPPTFLWQTIDDEVIPYAWNFVKIKERLEENMIPHVAKTVGHGNHGLGLGTGSEADGWVDEAISFWENLRRTGND